MSDSQRSYRSILKSTSLIGGASVINILISMVRTKFVAILLGPTGVGLLGIYAQITTLISTATGMGISNSGVRQVAEAVGTEDDVKIARTVITLRRAAWLTGVLGMLVMIMFCASISRISFESENYAVWIAILGVTLPLSAVAAGQSCILRGTRRIADVAKISVISSLGGTFLSIPCYYLWGVNGIVIGLVLSAIISLAVSWWYARRVAFAAVVMSWSESWREAHTLFSLGLSFMGAGLIGGFTTYLIQVLIVRQFSLADFGIYQAAFSLSGVLAGFVIGAMGTDYYPRLTAVASDNTSVFRMVNEQSQVSILLALPGLVAMMIFSPLIIQLFYAETFNTAVPLLRWCILGILGRVISWPLGYVILAKGRGMLFFFTESIDCIFHLLALMFCMRVWGLDGAGIAFMILYVFHLGLMIYVVHRLVGMTWTKSSLLTMLLSITVMSIIIMNCILNKNIITMWTINITAQLVVTTICIMKITKITGTSIKLFKIRTSR